MTRSGLAGETPEGIARAVREALAVDAEEFLGLVEPEAERLKRDLRAGAFDNAEPLVGLEHEFHVLDRADGSLRRIRRGLLDLVGLEPELGRHNAELGTRPQPLNEFGLDAQLREVQARVEITGRRLAREGLRLWSDGVATVGPREESIVDYFEDAVDVDGVRVAHNASPALRYHLLANGPLETGRRLSAPGVDYRSGTILPTSLTASIQPHYQVPRATDLPERFGYALRVAGPLLALAVNAPFYPPALYEADDHAVVLDDGPQELRVPTFEGTINPLDPADGGADTGPGATGKVRFPRDVATVEAAVDRLVADPPAVPRRVDGTGRFDDRHRHLRAKHGSYWRWVRPVFEAPTRREAHVRIEFRALPAQPTIRDSIALLAAFAGLMEALPAYDHPVADLAWTAARENFYAAVREGLDADLAWILADGEGTTDADRVLGELLAYARDGLELRGIDRATADGYLRPLSTRLETGVTPAGWKRRLARRHVDAGASVADAIRATHDAAVAQQSGTLVRGTFADWATDPPLTGAE